MPNSKVSFEQALRFLTLDEVLTHACSLHVPPIVERHLVALPTNPNRSRATTVPASGR